MGIIFLPATLVSAFESASFEAMVPGGHSREFVGIAALTLTATFEALTDLSSLEFNLALTEREFLFLLLFSSSPRLSFLHSHVLHVPQKVNHEDPWEMI